MKLFDTNAILTLQEQIFDEPFYLSSETLLELEEIKSSGKKSEDVRYAARHITKLLFEKSDNYTTIFVDLSILDIVDRYGLPHTPDNIICACAKSLELKGEDVESISYDILANLTASKIFGLKTNKSLEYTNVDINEYKGYKTVVATEEELVKTYEKDNCENVFDCLVNEYVVINDAEGNFCDVLKWTGSKYVAVWNKPFKSRQLGSCKPLDTYQRMAFDTIANNDISLLFGKAGSGKTTIPLSFIMQSLESGKYKKCYIVYSYETLKNQKTLGFVKGTQTEKAIQSGSIGSILATKLGSISEVERLMASDMIEIIPTANLRGVEFGEDTLVYATEAQNLDLYALKTLIQRCKTDSKLLLDGDIKEQCDTVRGIGLFRMIDVFKDNKCFGCVKLKNNYRNEIGNLADLL